MNLYNVQCTKQAASWHQTWANCSRLWSKAVYLSVPIMSRWISLKSLYLRSGHTNSNSRKTTINLFKTMAPTRNWDILRLLGFNKSIFWNTMTQNRVFGPNNTKYWTLQDPPPPWVLSLDASYIWRTWVWLYHFFPHFLPLCQWPGCFCAATKFPWDPVSPEPLLVKESGGAQ